MKTKSIPLGICKENFISYNALVVGQNKSDREHILRMLVGKEFSISSAVQTLKEASEELEDFYNTSKQPDILIADIELQGPSAILHLKKIRNYYPELKILVIHNESSKNLIQQVLDLRINSFDLKPIADRRLTRKLAQIFNRDELVPKEQEVYSKDKIINLKNLHIPTLPEVTFKVLRVDTNNPEVGWEELENIISPDKSIASSVIRLANSTHYGRSGKISTLQDAIQLLGVQNVKNLVFLLTKKNIYGRIRGRMYQKFLQELPILSALIAIDLADILHTKDLKKHLFLNCLLGRIGMMVFALNFHEQYKEVLRFYEFGIKNLVSTEKDRFNYDSQTLTIKVFNLWKMPDGFLRALQHKNFSKYDIPKVTIQDKITRLAEIFALRLIGVNLDKSEQKVLEKLLLDLDKPELVGMFSTEYYDLIQDHPLYTMAFG